MIARVVLFTTAILSDKEGAKVKVIHYDKFLLLLLVIDFSAVSNESNMEDCTFSFRMIPSRGRKCRFLFLVINCEIESSRDK